MLNRKTARAKDRSKQKAAEIETVIQAPAQIRLLYESADGRFCVFEDANGHITAVRASKLA